MKDIMARESSTEDQGIASFAYSPADASTPLLFSLAQPFDKLLEDLPKQFAGKTLIMKEVYAQHSVDTPYIKKNYKTALRALEIEGKLIADPPLSKRPGTTFSDSVKVTFK